MRKILVTIALIMVFLNGCSSNDGNLLRFQYYTEISNSDKLVSLIAYTKSESDSSNYQTMLSNELNRYKQIFDETEEFPGIKNIATINANAGVSKVIVDEDLIELLLLSKEWYDLTNGVIDVTKGAVKNIWLDYYLKNIEAKFYLKDPIPLPSSANLSAALKCSGWDKVIIDEDENSVFITDKCVSLSVSSYAESFALEKSIELLEENGLTHALISYGSLTATIDTKPGNEAWVIGFSYGHPWPGFTINRNDDNQFMVSKVEPQSFAQLKGLKNNDLIVKVNGVNCKELDKNTEIEACQNELSRLDYLPSIEITIERDSTSILMVLDNTNFSYATVKMPSSHATSIVTDELDTLKTLWDYTTISNINLKTGTPSKSFKSVNVVAHSPLLSSFLSDALFNLDYDAGVKLIEQVASMYPNEVIGATWLMVESQVPFNHKPMVIGLNHVLISNSLEPYYLIANE